MMENSGGPLAIMREGRSPQYPSSQDEREFQTASGARLRIARPWAELIQVDSFNPADVPMESASRDDHDNHDPASPKRLDG